MTVLARTVHYRGGPVPDDRVHPRCPDPTDSPLGHTETVISDGCELKRVEFIPDSRGITSAVAIVLLVGVTVVVAGVTGYYALLFADQLQNPAPALSIESSQQTGTVVEGNKFNNTTSDAQANWSVTFVHASGASVEPERLSVTVNGYPAYDVFNPADGNYTYATIARPPVHSTFGVGESARVVVYGRVFLTATHSPSGNPSFFHNNGTLKRSLDASNDHRANELRPGDTVRLTWTSPTGLNTYVLAETVVR